MPRSDAPQAAIPSVDRVARLPDLAPALARHGRDLVIEAIRDELTALRATLSKGKGAVPDDTALAARVLARVAARATPSLKPVFNLTGTVLHTNLGRAPLPAEAVAAMAAVAGAANLEYDLAAGRRGDRDAHIEDQLRRLTGAEAATVVNNNAAAVLLVLNSLALRKEVPVSRGELIEIGDSFRMPDLMARAGCRLREVGTTNRTHLKDYAEAIGPRSALLMKVHTSNYVVEGFTAAVGEGALAALAHEHDLPLVVDLGSGTLIDLAAYGLPHETTPRETLAAGADLVTFSGDKLLGGSQAGIIVGRRDLVKKIKRNPMRRALRIDKTTLAALAAVLALYDDPARLAERLPTLRLLTRARADIRALAGRVRPVLAERLQGTATVDVVDCESQIGSGALPADQLPSSGLAIRPPPGTGDAWLRKLAAAFRALPIPVIGRLSGGVLTLDLRCLEDDAEFTAQLDRLTPP